MHPQPQSIHSSKQRTNQISSGESLSQARLKAFNTQSTVDKELKNFHIIRPRMLSKPKTKKLYGQANRISNVYSNHRNFHSHTRDANFIKPLDMTSQLFNQDNSVQAINLNHSSHNFTNSNIQQSPPATSNIKLTISKGRRLPRIDFTTTIDHESSAFFKNPLQTIQGPSSKRKLLHQRKNHRLENSILQNQRLQSVQSDDVVLVGR